MTAATAVKVTASEEYKQRLSKWLKDEMARLFRGGQGEGQNEFEAFTTRELAPWDERGFNATMLSRWKKGEQTQPLTSKTLPRIGILKGFVELPPPDQRTEANMRRLKAIAAAKATQWLEGIESEESLRVGSKPAPQGQRVIPPLPAANNNDLIAALEGRNLSSAELAVLAHWIVDRMASSGTGELMAMTPVEMPDNTLSLLVKGLCDRAKGVEKFVASEIDNALSADRIEEIINGSPISTQEAEILKKPCGVTLDIMVGWGVVYDRSGQ